MGSTTSKPCPFIDFDDKEKLYEKYQELNSFLVDNQYVLDKHLGAGQFGTIFEGAFFGGSENSKVAIKFQLLSLIKEGVISCKEVIFLRNYHNPYIVRLLNFFYFDELFIQVFEYQAGGDLHKLIQESDSGLTEGQAARFYLQIGNGLFFAHQEGVAHRNLKPRNILLDSTKTIARISDFGLSEFYYDPKTGCTKYRWDDKGTPNYLPPEYLPRSKYYPQPTLATRADVWAMGVIMFEMVYGFLPWTYKPGKKTEFLSSLNQPIVTLLWPQDKQTSRDFTNFVVQHFVMDPQCRPNISALLLDPFLVNGINCLPVYSREEHFQHCQRIIPNSYPLRNNESLELAQEFHERGYEFKMKLGEGTYSHVYGGMFQGKLCAVKATKPTEPGKPQKIDASMVKELTFLKKIRHPNIVNVLDVFPFDGRLMMTLEFAPGGDLHAYIKSHQPGGLPEPVAARFYLQMGNGLQYCHLMGLTHKDLKPENVLMNETQTVCKLSDLGLSSYFYELHTGEEDGEMSLAGTRVYFSAEKLKAYIEKNKQNKKQLKTKSDDSLKSHHPTKSDVWALGVIMFEMVYCQFPFWDATPEQLDSDVENNLALDMMKKFDNSAFWPNKRNPPSTEFQSFVRQHFKLESVDPAVD